MNDQERGALIEAIGTALSGRWDTEGWHNESDPWTDGEVALEVIAERGCAVVTIAAPPPTANGPDMPEKRGTRPPPAPPPATDWQAIADELAAALSAASAWSSTAFAERTAVLAKYRAAKEAQP